MEMKEGNNLLDELIKWTRKKYTRQEMMWVTFFLANKDIIANIGDIYTVLRHVRMFLRGREFEHPRQKVILKVTVFGITISISKYNSQ